MKQVIVVFDLPGGTMTGYKDIGQACNRIGISRRELKKMDDVQFYNGVFVGRLDLVKSGRGGERKKK